MGCQFVGQRRAEFERSGADEAVLSSIDIPPTWRLPPLQFFSGVSSVDG